MYSENLENKEELLEYVRNNSGKNICHEYVETLQNFFFEGISITANCPRFTLGNYYSHSYIELGDMIIDLTLNVVMDKELYYRLMKPTELVRIKNSDVEFYKDKLFSILSTDKNNGVLEDDYFMLILARYNQVAMKYNQELFSLPLNEESQKKL